MVSSRAEYEHLNGADKTLREIVGLDGIKDLIVPNSVAREERKHEIETRLIPSGEFKILRPLRKLHHRKQYPRGTMGVWLRRGFKPTPNISLGTKVRMASGSILRS